MFWYCFVTLFYCSCLFESYNCAIISGAPIDKSVKILTDDKEYIINSTLKLVCKAYPSVTDNEAIIWRLNGTDIFPDNKFFVSFEECQNATCVVLYVKYLEMKDVGNYTCGLFDPDSDNAHVSEPFSLKIAEPKIVGWKGSEVRAGSGSSLVCVFKGVLAEDITWGKESDVASSDRLKKHVKNEVLNDTIIESILHLPAVNIRSHNGTYLCGVFKPSLTIYQQVPLLVLDVPDVTIDTVKAVGASQIFVNWTVNNGNREVMEYFLQFLKIGTDKWTYYGENIRGSNTSCIIKNLEPNTAYKLKIHARNEIGEGRVHEYPYHVTTLQNDPDFVPELSVKGVTGNSIDIGWTSPPSDLKDHIHYYKLLLFSNSTHEGILEVEYSNNYMFVNLQSATTYYFKVAACSEFTRSCGNWSVEISGTTLDGVSGPPENVNLSCKFDNISGFSLIRVSWWPPKHTNGEITYYNVTAVGEANFYNEDGEPKTAIWGPESKTARGNSTQFERVPANTNYTIYVSGKTRSRGTGKEAVHSCVMPQTTPNKERLNGIKWEKVQEHGRWILKLFLPRISERNGTICCYRVFLIRLGRNQSPADLPSPKDSVIFSYHYVHQSASGGAYIADMFDSNFVNKNIFLGDGESIAANYSNLQCRKCPVLTPKIALITETPPFVPNIKDNDDDEFFSEENDTGYSSEKLVSERNAVPDSTYADILAHTVYDGALDNDSNYTGFLQLVVYGSDNNFISAYSNYFDTLKPGPQIFEKVPTEDLFTSLLQFCYLQITCTLIGILVMVLFAFCLLHHYTKQVAEIQGVEMSLRNSFRHLCRSLRGSHIPVSSNLPDVSPIPRAGLVDKFAELAKDSDYGFEQEFEMLPDKFTDRTTKASESRENACKNRYPDIKAYDQTRVKLSQVDGIIGSDYINANFVVSYKERKKFICAQGPMENTVRDFWRMIWEQHLEIILMLTNLEEYSKTKCAKYWPDKEEKHKMFEDITVHYITEKRYSDYVVRELKIVRTMNHNKDPEERSVYQYHFLVWKDFQAPEHPSGILKFIRRVNEAYSFEKGPILVHCSAGVGRTGTLVALDSLLQQLEYEGQVLVFNTVCDLRRQRNFLVQSLKQYIFVYRTLLEYAQFGNTEIRSSEMKTTIEKLKQTDNGKLKSKMEEEFEKLSFTVNNQEPKLTSVGSAQENTPKNRSSFIIPFDRNRVILTPIPGREYSTYINASFIEGYDNKESFIITQDPVPDITVIDFWRMISEQNVTTIVMLSSTQDGQKRCSRYWPDEEMLYGNVNVKHIQSESCPYYTRREFVVTNVKMEENIVVMQYQYNGWPTVEGEVPEVTRGMIELVDSTTRAVVLDPTEDDVIISPIVVHCEFGSDRSSMFVALSILTQQLKIERRIDVVTVARKLRAQRRGMLITFAQYEFLYRAILNYADLHHLSNDSDLTA